MANTVNILSFNNTFGDLVAQQNKAAVELNDLGANNYTKDSGTLLLVATGTALSVTNTAILGTAIVSGPSNLLGDVTSTANATFTGSGFAFQVANNAVIAKTLITDSITSNTLVRTTTINGSGTAFVNGLTSNTLIRTVSLNTTGTAYADALIANTVVFAPFINASTTGIFNNITANNTLTSANITTGNLTVTQTFTSPTITSGSFTGQATLTGTSTAPTVNANTSNTQIATTAYVKAVLNSGNTFNIFASTTNPFSITMNQNVNTANSVQFNSLGIGTAASGTTGEIRATNNITAYYSDDRLKKRLGNIENALAKVMALNGFQYEANEIAQSLGYAVKPEIGLSAQEVQAVLPEVVVPAPIDEKYLTIHYERVIPLLVEAIKELKKEIDELKK
jgi:hypothetical protein